MAIKITNIGYKCSKKRFFSLGDSMLYDSGYTPIWADAKDENGNKYQIRIAVQGHVKVCWGDNTYTKASQMPAGLRKLFRQNCSLSHLIANNVDVIENNWWELFIEKNGKTIRTEVVDFVPNEFSNEDEFKQWLIESILHAN